MPRSTISGSQTIDDMSVTNSISIGVLMTAVTATINGLMTSISATVNGLLTAQSLTVTGESNLQNTILTGTFSAGNTALTNVSEPVAAQDAATKNYVDTQGASVSYGPNKPVRLINRKGNIDVAAGGLLVIDGVTTFEDNRVLLADQTDGKENLVYLVRENSAWVQDPLDFAFLANAQGYQVFVKAGDVYANTGWLQTINIGTLSITTVGIYALNWRQFTVEAVPHRFTWGFENSNYVAVTMSAFPVNAVQRIDMQVYENMQIGTPWSYTLTGFAVWDGITDVVYTFITNMSFPSALNALVVEVSGSTLNFKLVRGEANGVAKGYAIVNVFDVEGSHSGVTVVGGL